jgi:hypothetical protein
LTASAFCLTTSTFGMTGIAFGMMSLLCPMVQIAHREFKIDCPLRHSNCALPQMLQVRFKMPKTWMKTVCAGTIIIVGSYQVIFGNPLSIFYGGLQTFCGYQVIFGGYQLTFVMR